MGSSGEVVKFTFQLAEFHTEDICMAIHEDLGQTSETDIN